MWWAPVQKLLQWARLTGTGSSEPPSMPCTGNHENHICALACRQDFARIKSMTGAPAFVCTNCGRVAASEQNLCNPHALDAIATGMPPVA